MILLVDVSYLAHRALHTMKDLSFEDMPTGVMFGFFEQIKTICYKFKTNKVHLFFDSRKSYRKKAYPQYKANRKNKTPEEKQLSKILYKQINKLKSKILPAMGFPCYLQTGLESDDLIAYVSRKKALQEINSERAIIITSDGDLYQCITHNVDWYDPARNLRYNWKSFYPAKKVIPERWSEVKSMAGCSTDNVKGIKGVGEKTAIKAIDNKLPENYKSYKAIMKGGEIIERNKLLVRLPHLKTKPFELQSIKYNIKRFFKIVKRYGMYSFLDKQSKREWKRLFRGEFK